MANITVTSQISKHGTQFEQQHVRYVYDEIATSMNDLRHKAWPNVKRFLKSFPPGSLIADIGCGNGRYLSVNKSSYKVGVDVCTALVNNARTKGHEVAYGDNLQIPFRDDSFDGVVSIGVIHHLCSSERRIAATKELSRILRPGGKLMLYVWAYEQNHRKFESQDVLIPWHGSHKGRQLRIGSASSIQSYGQSSTSSVSEDEITDQSAEINTSSASSPTFLKRQNSLSADDLSALQELSDFKPSYYSLDFNGSPQHEKKKSDNDVKYVWNKNGAKIYHSSASTNKLISECRKLEASLRAMSAGSLDELNKQSRDEDFMRSLEVADNTGQVNEVNDAKYRKEEFNSEIIENHIEDNDVGITLDWNVGALENDDFESEIPNEIEINENDSDERSCKSSVDMNCNSNKCKINIEYQNNFDSVHESWKSSSNHPKLNPFMRDNLLEPNHFNSFSSSCGEVESFEVIQDVQHNLNDFSEVGVDFKPFGKNKTAKKRETSFFSSVKSKLLEIFDDDSNKMSDNTRQQSKPDIQSRKSTSNVQYKASKLKPELSMELLDLATKLNFKVREFPLSSCPDVVSDSQSSHGSDQSGCSSYLLHDHESANQCTCYKLTDSSKGYCEHCNYSSKNNFNNEVCINTEKCQKGTDVLGRVYDGYIKLDVNQTNGINEKNKVEHLQKGALMPTTHAKNGCTIPRNGESIQSNGESIPRNGESIPRNGESIQSNELRMQKECLSRCEQDCNGPERQMPLEQCNINKKNAQNYSYSSQNCKLQENGHNNVFRSSAECNGENDRVRIKNGSTKEITKEDDSVFDTGNDSISSKLCRYYHVFREGEVENMISTYITDLQIVQCTYDHGNWCVIAEKL